MSVCGIIARWPMRGWKFWPSYLYLNLRYGTRTFGPVVSSRWKTGSYRLRIIGIGLVVYVGLNLVAQPCFVKEAWGLGRPTPGLQELRDFGGRYPPTASNFSLVPRGFNYSFWDSVSCANNLF